MIRGIGKETVIPYVLEEERSLPEEHQTVFYIRPKTGRESNIQTREYMKSLKDRPDGTKELDVNKADIADRASFKATVSKIENYAFPAEYYEERKALKDTAKQITLKNDFGESEVVLVTPVIDDPILIDEVCRTLPSSVLREVSSVSDNYSKLRESQKK